MGSTHLLASDRGREATNGARVGTAGAYCVVVAMLGLFALLLVFFSAREPSTRVTRDEFGPAWPLAIPSVVLTCHFRQEITVTWGGATYSLNRPAEDSGYDDVAAILADGVAGKADLTALIDAGLKLCE